MVNIKILIAALLITNAITATIAVKTQSCSNAPAVDEAKRAAYIAEIKRIRGDLPPDPVTPTIIPGNGTR